MRRGRKKSSFLTPSSIINILYGSYPVSVCDTVLWVAAAREVFFWLGSRKIEGLVTYLDTGYLVGIENLVKLGKDVQIVVLPVEGSAGGIGF